MAGPFGFIRAWDDTTRNMKIAEPLVALVSRRRHSRLNLSYNGATAQVAVDARK